jgi:hypothetical protein
MAKLLLTHGLMDAAVESVVIHLGESSGYMSIDEGEFWSLSEDERMGEMVQISVCFLFKLYIFFK